MLVYFSLFFAMVACCFEAYLLFSYVRCKGKYPPFVVSFGEVKKDMLGEAEKLISQFGRNMKIVDLGCGSGSLLLPLARKFPECSFYGYEWDVLPYYLAKVKSRNFKNLTIYKKDFMKENLSDFDLILCNVGTGLETDLGNKLNSEINTGAVVLSEIFKLGALKQKQIVSSSICGVKCSIFLYKKQ